MNEQELPAEVEWMELRLRLDATITVQGTGDSPSEWLKPGAEAATRWRGVPSEVQVKLAYTMMQEHMLAKCLEDLIVHLHQRMVAARRHG